TMKLKLAMGRVLHDKLLTKRLLKEKRGVKADNRHRWKYREPRWSTADYVRAGNWLLDCVLEKLPGIFVLDWGGLPCITKEGEEYALALCAELVYRNPAFLPATEPLKGLDRLAQGRLLGRRHARLNHIRPRLASRYQEGDHARIPRRQHEAAR